MSTATLFSTVIRVFQGTADAEDWANNAYYSLQNQGLTVREGVDNCTSWEECSGREGGEEYVTMRVPPSEADAAIAHLESLGYEARREPYYQIAHRDAFETNWQDGNAYHVGADNEFATLAEAKAASDSLDATCGWDTIVVEREHGSRNKPTVVYG